MLYLGDSMMTDELQSTEDWRIIFIGQHNWTLLTAVNLMLFSLLHNPCATTIYTVWKETKRVKWTVLGAVLPLVIAFGVTLAVAQAVRLFGG